MAANIQAYLENLKQPWGQIYYDILFDQLQDIKGKRVLDFGSGFGLVANHLAQENQVLAIEPNEEMVALRTQDYPYQQLVGSLDQLESFEDASFDVILCHNVLEYVENRKAVLKAFIRLLKPGGLLSIVKHNEVGRVLQTVVFVEDLFLEVLDYQGIRVFYALQDNRFKDQEGWRESMLKMELAVGAGGLPRVPLSGYRLLPAL